MGISLWQLLIILVIVLLLFGTKKLRSIGGDLGGAVKGFRESVTGKDEAATKESDKVEGADANRVIEGEASPTENKKV